MSFSLIFFFFFRMGLHKFDQWNDGRRAFEETLGYTQEEIPSRRGCETGRE